MKRIITTIFVLLLLVSCSSGTASEDYTKESFIGTWQTNITNDFGNLTLNLIGSKRYKENGTYDAENILKFSNQNNMIIAEYSMSTSAKWKISDNELTEYAKTVNFVTKKSSNNPIVQQLIMGLKQMAENKKTVVSTIVYVDENKITTDTEGEETTIIRVK